MQLAKIKVSGFKSFVDPTTIVLPSNLVAIVGPNGCGKSNIIDAVTWVMGESSPKYLRGEALTDVIFNGSTTRKPVGQASVELIFDNSDGTIGGEYSTFAEISIKRVINRESDSVYYLNNVRCRKRDIVDIFLGTGLGPRSYSIIGQNMINRVIEAKPEDLRTYLEEAAGISKYKERRHETELRINHTKENLARVNDLRSELEKQLSHLKHQANVAEKFKSLKQQERILRAELYGIEWRQLDRVMVDHTLKIQREETALEARQSELTGTERDIEQLRHEQRVAHDAFQEVQRRYYSIGNEITRIEQDILHHQERQHQWENDLKQTGNEWQAVKNQMSDMEMDLHEVEHEIERVEPLHLSAKNSANELKRELLTAEEAMQLWQNRWDEFQQISAKTAQTAQVEKTHIQHFEQRISSLQKRLEQLYEDQGQINLVELNQEIEEYNKKSFEVTEKLEFETQKLDEIRKQISALQAGEVDSNANLDTIRSEIQRLRGYQASLEALQQTALGQRDNRAEPWIRQNQLADKPRLAQHIEVKKGWELAVEKVLGLGLQAICVDEMRDVASRIEDFKTGNACFFETRGEKPLPKVNHKGEMLIDKVKSKWPLDSFLAGIYTAESSQEALDLLDKLNDTESVITKEGVWFNRSWIKILKETDTTAGTFQREQELKEIATRLEHLQETEKELEERIAKRKEQLQALEIERDQLQQSYSLQQAIVAQAKAQSKMKQERLAELKTQTERLRNEQDECSTLMKTAEVQLMQARSLYQQATVDLENETRTREELLKMRENTKERLQFMRENVNKKNEEMHEFEIRFQTAKSQRGSIQQNIIHLQNQLASLNERKITLQSELSSMPPLETIKKSLSRSLDKHVSVEVELNTARVATESLDQEFRNLEEKRQIIGRDITKIRNALEGYRVELQGWKVKADTIQEQMKEIEFRLEDILKQLTQEATPEEWQTKVEQVVQRINRLGPINLVAIDEYTTCLERKLYFDKQLEDLQSGLATLEEAIGKIDRETRSRFKETFDRVNDHFQELFPTIFGGGKSYLELTHDNLLEAGVTVMACPPGKRNSSIYLLSGGEKSLTALALIFSIFQLNPAPFCLLDEVDAALDDANVLRFTRLVKSMAEKTQFIFISHNKISIEMAEHLIGVTMHEPGVSRLVSVDIEKALSFAGA